MCDAEADAVDPDCGWSCFDDETDCIDLLIKGSLCVKESDEEVPAPSKLCLCDCEAFGENSIKARCLSVLISAGFLFTLADVVMEGISLHSALTTQRVMGSKVESRYANTWLAFYILFTAFCIPMELLLIWYRHFGLMALLDRILLRRHNKVAPEVDAEATIESSDGETEQGLDDEVRKTSNHGTGKATDDELGTQYGSSIKCSDDVIGKDLNDGITKASSGGARKAPDVGARERPGSSGVRPLYVMYAWAGGTTHRWKEVIIQSLLTIKTLLVLFTGYGQLVFAISAEGNYKWFHGDLNQSTTTFLFFTALTGFLINYFHVYKAGVNQNHYIVRNLFFLDEFLLAGMSLTSAAMSMRVAYGGGLVLVDSPSQLFGSMVLWSILSYIIAFLLLTSIGRRIVIAVIWVILHCLCHDRSRRSSLSL